MAVIIDPRSVIPTGPPELPEPAEARSPAAARAIAGALDPDGPPKDRPFKIMLAKTPDSDDGLPGEIIGYLGVTPANYAILVPDEVSAVTFRLIDNVWASDGSHHYFYQKWGRGDWFSLTRYSYAAFFMLPGWTGGDTSNLREMEYKADRPGLSGKLTCEGKMLSSYNYSNGDYLYFWDAYEPLWVKFVDA